MPKQKRELNEIPYGGFPTMPPHSLHDYEIRYDTELADFRHQPWLAEGLALKDRAAGYFTLSIAALGLILTLVGAKE